MWRRGNGMAAAPNISTTAQAANLSTYLIGAENQTNLSGAYRYCNAEIGVVAFTAGLTDLECVDYTLSIKTLWETLTGLTLP